MPMGKVFTLNLHTKMVRKIGNILLILIVSALMAVQSTATSIIIPMTENTKLVIYLYLIEYYVIVYYFIVLCIRWN